MFTIYDGRLSFYQWDSGEKVVLSEPPSKDCQVHFENPSGEVCYVVTPKTVDGVLTADVPNILLQSAEPITVWCYVTNGNEKHTIVTTTFGVVARQKPADYVYTETETGGGGTGGGSNLPITYIKSEDKTNPQELCKIDAGIYILYGYFTPYAGSGRNISYDNRLAICDVNTRDGTRYFQVLSPYKNTVLYLVVTDSTYERTDTELSGIVTKVDTALSDSSTYPLQNKAIAEALKKLEDRITALECNTTT